jgi:hypothetical protein
MYNNVLEILLRAITNYLSSNRLTTRQRFYTPSVTISSSALRFISLPFPREWDERKRDPSPRKQLTATA